ncbi:MAG: hypothetical protein V4534_08975 [Myxococcota bacterium]
MPLAFTALKEVSSGEIIAYLDPFGNLGSGFEGLDLLLSKPESLTGALAMSSALLATPGIDLLILDSLFWMPGKLSDFEQALRHLALEAAKHQKRVVLINPENGIRKWLLKSLKTFCSQQIRIAD